MQKLIFVTGNKGKMEEAQKILGIPLEIVDLDIDEVQSLDAEKVVRRKAEDAYKIVKKPLFVDDVSAEIAAWNGFPGPLVKWLYEAGNNSHELAIKMLKGEKNKAVKIIALIAYHDGKTIHVFEGSFKGIAVTKRGKYGWGFDPYVIPEGQTKTFAQLGPEVKNKVSHRARALKKFKKFLDSKEMV